MDDSNKKRKATCPIEDTKDDVGQIGKCIYCGHIGIDIDYCKCCNNYMKNIKKYEEEEPPKLGFAFETYSYCKDCVTVQDKGKLCHHCWKDLEEPINETVIQKCVDQTSLPRCALLPFSKCTECFHNARFLAKHMPVKINMAKSILETVREYEALVEMDYTIDLKKNLKDKRVAYLFQSTRWQNILHPTITGDKLRKMIEHHHKFCLCSICKWWILSNYKQDNVDNTEVLFSCTDENNETQRAVFAGNNKIHELKQKNLPTKEKDNMVGDELFDSGSRGKRDSPIQEKDNIVSEEHLYLGSGAKRNLPDQKEDNVGIKEHHDSVSPSRRTSPRNLKKK